MSAKPHIKMRISLPATIHQKIADYRFQGRFETRGQALAAIIAAGLNVLAKPAESSPPAEVKEKPRKLISYAGHDRSEHRSAEWLSRP